MKTLVIFVLVNLVAFAHCYPRFIDDSDESDEDVVRYPSFFTNPFGNFPSIWDRIFGNSDSDIFSFKPPTGKANTTSDTTVINGHVVTVNRTTYSGGDDNSNFHYKITYIDIKPENASLPSGDNAGEVKPEVDEDRGQERPTEAPSSSREETTTQRDVETRREDVGNNEISSPQEIETIRT